jgi:hypothetical protein
MGIEPKIAWTTTRSVAVTPSPRRKVRVRGFEPLAFRFRTERSSKLSYTLKKAGGEIRTHVVSLTRRVHSLSATPAYHLTVKKAPQPANLHLLHFKLPNILQYNYLFVQDVAELSIVLQTVS